LRDFTPDRDAPDERAKGYAIGIEASRGYERGVIRALLAEGIFCAADQSVQASPVRQGQWRSGQKAIGSMRG
jgi:transposase